jgi:hypothetical protein
MFTIEKDTIIHALKKKIVKFINLKENMAMYFVIFIRLI